MAQASRSLAEDFEKLSANDSLSYLRRNRNGRLTIAVVGKTGEGKSSTVNTLIHHATPPRPRFFNEAESPNSVTKNCEECTVNLFGLKCRLLDTVGMFDTGTTPEQYAELQLMQIRDLEEDHKYVLTSLAEVINLCTDGIDSFLIVVDGTSRITRETRETIKIIQRYLGDSMLDHCIFILTRADIAKPGTMKKMEENLAEYLRTIGYRNISNRFVHFDNKNRPIENVMTLMNKIRMNLEDRQGFPYTNVSFQTAQIKLEEEKKKLRSELEFKMECYKQIATDRVLAEFIQENEIYEYQLYEYDVATYSIQDEASATRDIYRNEIENIKSAMARSEARKRRDIAIAVRNASDQCAEEFNAKVKRLERKYFRR